MSALAVVKDLDVFPNSRFSLCPCLEASKNSATFKTILLVSAGYNFKKDGTNNAFNYHRNLGFQPAKAFGPRVSALINRVHGGIKAREMTCECYFPGF